jgi:hypothetical protein
MFQKDFRALRSQGSQVGRHGALQKPEVTHVAEPSSRLVSRQQRQRIARLLATTALSLTLLILPIERLAPCLIDLGEELAGFRRSLVNSTKDEIVESPPEGGSGVEVPPGDQNYAVHVAEAHLTLIEFLQQLHSR